MKKQIIAAYESGGDWKLLKQRLGVSTSTAYRWIKNGNKIDQRGGKRYQKIHEIHKIFIAEKIEKNPRITFQELKDQIMLKFDLNISNECIRNHLDMMLYTLKDVRYELKKGNSDKNKEKIKLFAEMVLNFQSGNLPIVYIDETNFNLHITRPQGRSKVGTRCFVLAAGSKGANIHLIGAISSIGFMYYEIKKGFFKEEAQEWVKECLRSAEIKHGGPVVLVIDNAPCHSNIENILILDEFKNHKILRLGPYSPMLNPIEFIWSIIKSNVKKELSEKMSFILNEENFNGLSKTEFRTRELEKAIVNSLNLITLLNCANVCAKILRIIPNVLNSENMKY